MYSNCTQLKGVCTEINNVYITFVATRSLKLMTSLSGTATFLEHLKSLYSSLVFIQRILPLPESLFPQRGPELVELTIINREK